MHDWSGMWGKHFWRNQGTNDQLRRLETYIHNGLIKNHHVVSIFFDLEKVYDTTWRYRILKDLYKTGIKGNLATSIKNFLSHRTFTVQHGNTSSDIYKQETGVPQGSILSVTLFILKINCITESISTEIEKFLYVDNFAITYSSPNMPTLKRQMQNYLNKIKKWTHENGFKFSKTKTVCIHFCKRRTYHLDPEIDIDSHTITVVQQAK